MKFEKPRRLGTIHVDLVHPTTMIKEGWMKPVEFRVEDPPTVYTRIPHGAFAVKIMTSDVTDVIVHVDGEPRLQKQVPAGISYLSTDGEGNPFVFGAETPAAEDQDKSADAPVTTHGQVFVSVRFADKLSADGVPLVPPDGENGVFFQMNPPGEHEETMAGLLSKVVAPPEAPGIDDDGAACVPHNRPRRICNCGH